MAPIQRADKRRVCGAEPGGSERRGPRGAPRPPAQRGSPVSSAWLTRPLQLPALLPLPDAIPCKLAEPPLAKGSHGGLSRSHTPSSHPSQQLPPFALADTEETWPTAWKEESGEHQPPRSPPSSPLPDKRLSTPAVPLNVLISPQAWFWERPHKSYDNHK